jgi:hypothetical protein
MKNGPEVLKQGHFYMKRVIRPMWCAISGDCQKFQFSQEGRCAYLNFPMLGW